MIKILTKELIDQMESGRIFDSIDRITINCWIITATRQQIDNTLLKLQITKIHPKTMNMFFQMIKSQRATLPSFNMVLKDAMAYAFHVYEGLKDEEYNSLFLGLEKHLRQSKYRKLFSLEF